MGGKERIEELVHDVVDNVQEKLAIDEKKVLVQTKHDLQQLENDMTYATKVTEALFSAGLIDTTKKNSIETRLQSPEQRGAAVQEIISTVEDIENKYDILGAGEKEKVKKVTEILSQSRSSLNTLKQEVTQEGTDRINGVEKEITDAATAKLNSSKWTAWLADDYQEYVHRKVSILKGEKQADEDWKTKIKHVIADAFFGAFGGWLVGKELMKKLNGIKDIAEKSITDITAKKDELVAKGGELIKEVSPEKLKEDEKNIKNYIRVMLQKHGKNIDEKTLERVIKRINMKKLAQDNTPEMQKLLSQNWGDANIVDSLFEATTMPFYAFFEVISALNAEGVITYNDIAYETVGETIKYGLKTFKLFGVGLRFAAGQISLKNIGAEVKRLYDQSPDAAKTLIWATMYRTAHSPLFRFALNASECMAKAALWPLMEAKHDIHALKNISDGFHGHMSTAVDELEEFIKYLPDGEATEVKKIVSQFRGEVAKFKDVNNVQMLIKESALKGDISLLELEKKYVTKFGSGSDFLAKYKGGTIPLDTVTSDLKEYTQSIGKSVRNNIKDADMFQKAQRFGNRVASAAKFQANELSVLDDAMRYLDNATKRYSTMMNNRGWTKGLKDVFAGTKTGMLTMKESLSDGKTYFNFQTAEDLEGFMKKMKYVSKQSPETLKFLIGKTPIFLVGGMALAEDGTMSEKMQHLMQDMWSLVPLVGPIMILRHSAKAGQIAKLDPETMGQIGLGVTLLGVDTWKTAKLLGRGEWAKFLGYVTQPITDIAEIMKFVGNTVKNTVILARDAANVIRMGKTADLGSDMWRFLKAEGRLGRIGLMGALVAGGYFTWDYFSGSGDIDDVTKKQITQYKNNPDKLDEDLEKSWSSMKQDERNNYLRAAVLRQGDISPDKIGDLDVKFDQGKNEYTVVLPTMMNKDQVRSLKGLVTDAMSRVQPGIKVNMQFDGAASHYFTEAIKQQFADIPEGERKNKIFEYVQAMGYDDPASILTSRV